MSENLYERASQIAQNGIRNGRYPLDTAGMDTDDEEWIDENPQYKDHIEDIYKELIKEKQKKIDPHKRSKKIAEGCIEVNKVPFDPGSMDTDDEEWIDENPQYIDYIQKIYKQLKN
jgi:hypothetical protein